MRSRQKGTIEMNENGSIEELREKMVSDVIISDFDKGIKRLEKEKQEMEEMLELVKSDKLDDCLEAFCKIPVLNALDRDGRDLFMEKILTLIGTKTLTLKELAFIHYDYDHKWRYKEGYADVITVDAKDKTIQINIENLQKVHPASFDDNKTDNLDMTIQLNKKWSKQYDPKTVPFWKVKERKMLRVISYQIAREQHYISEKFEKSTIGEKEEYNLVDYLNKIKSVYEDVKQIMALYVEKGFKDITPEEQEYEHFAIKTHNPMMKLRRTKSQELINRAITKDKEFIAIDGAFVNSSDSTHYECRGLGSILKHEEVLLFEDFVGVMDEKFNDGYYAFERVLTDSEMVELKLILAEQEQYIGGVSQNSNRILFEHKVIPVMYKVSKSGKITMKRMENKNEDNAYPFYSMSLIRTLLDIPGFKDWFERLSAIHYTNYQKSEYVNK